MIINLLRARSYNEFYELSMQYPEHKKTKNSLKWPMRDEAPSIKSRIRNIMKKPSNKMLINL